MRTEELQVHRWHQLDIPSFCVKAQYSNMSSPSSLCNKKLIPSTTTSSCSNQLTIKEKVPFFNMKFVLGERQKLWNNYGNLRTKKANPKGNL